MPWCSTSTTRSRRFAGTTAARKLVVETALQYLDRLSRDGVVASPLREELAAAYIRIGKVQGGAFLPNLGDSAGAIASFRKAIAAAGDDRDPGTRATADRGADQRRAIISRSNPACT